jgi:hypothetical protein
MSLTNVIAQVWAASILRNLTKTLVFAQEGIVNKDYEGDISQFGDRVHIHNIGEITIGDYTRNTPIGDPEILDDVRRTLIIDQSKFFNFMVDDLDRAQQRPKVMDEATFQAAYNLAEVADRFVASKYVDAQTVVDDGAGAALTLTTENLYSQLVKISVILDELNIPAEGRWAVVPPWVHALMLEDDRFISVGGERVLFNAQVARAAGFAILKSNNVATTGSAPVVTHILCGHASAISYAEQIVEVDPYRPQNFFADALKGLHLYGGKVV